MKVGVNMNKTLAHLSSEKIQTLMQRYYDGETVSKLLKEYDISVHASELYKLFPPEIFYNYTCEYCGNYLVTNRPSKMSIKKSRYESDLYCPVCGHRPYIMDCDCKNCTEKKNLLLKQKLEKIKLVYSQEKEPIDFNDITFENKVFLGALCRSLLKENLYEIKSYFNSNVLLTPDDTLSKKVYLNLFKSNIISVSPTSPLEAFDETDDNFPNTFYIYKVNYYLNLKFPSDKHDLFMDILNPNYYKTELADEAYLLWNEIAISECIQYLQYQLKNSGFYFNPGNKTYKNFEIILKDFSVSQIYGIIWKSVANISKLYLEKRMNKIHAANAIVSSCLRYAEQAKLNGWNLKFYNRIPDLPQSELSAFYFNKVLGIGDMGFKVPPTIV